MLLFKLIKLTRRIRILLGGYRKMEKKHYLFHLAYPYHLPPDVQEIYRRLIPHCWQYNWCSTTFLKQRFTARKLVDLQHQYHLRFYEDGAVSGHFEEVPEMSPIQHLKGAGLRSLTAEEREWIYQILTEEEA